MQTLNRRQFVKLGAAAMAATATPSLHADDPLGAGKAGKRKKPNVVFIFADQLRACSVGCYGNDQVITPNLDTLATQGMRCTNAIANAPVCTPYRGMLLTGRYPHSNTVIHNDIRLPDKEKLISESFKEAGYTTGYIGKWHLAGYRRDPVDAVNRRGWDFWATRNCSHDHFRPMYWLNDAKNPTQVEGWEPDVQTDLAIEYLKQKKDQPFCLFLSFGPPHNPYKATPEHLARYAGKKLTPRPNATEKDKKGRAWPLLDYLAMTTSLDDCVGRIMEALDEQGLSDDTILCFTSDHGDMMGSQGEKLKRKPWEESINVPFILRYPGAVAAGAAPDWLVSAHDLMPTFLGFCGIDSPASVQGFDWSPAFLGKAVENEPKDAFLMIVTERAKDKHKSWRGIRTKEWTYAFNGKGHWVLYDLKKDPYQMKNLVRDPTYAPVRDKLRKRLDQIRSDIGEDLPIPRPPPPKQKKKK